MQEKSRVKIAARKATPGARGERELLLRNLDEAYERAAWHGPNLRGALRGMTARRAAWRPGPGRHNIWELVVHAAYWKYAVRRRLTREKRGSFPVYGSNWFRRPVSATEKAWREDVALLDREHRLLREVIEKLPGGKLRAMSPGSRHPVMRLIYGIAAHDLYHTGQIQLLKALSKGRYD